MDYSGKLIQYLNASHKANSISRIGDELSPAPNCFKYFLSYEDLIKTEKADELFSLYIELFGDEHGKGYYCTKQGCGMTYPRTGSTVSEACSLKCECGGLLNNYYEIEQLKRAYKTYKDFRYNIMLDDDNHIVGFTCGGEITGKISDALLGEYYWIYKTKYPAIDKVESLIYRYFGYGNEGIISSIYFADSGGISPHYRKTLAPLIFTTRPLFQAAYENSNKHLVCINYAQSSMHKINLILGFDEIAKFGELVYMGLRDVTYPLALYQNYTSHEISNIFRFIHKQCKT